MSTTRTPGSADKKRKRQLDGSTTKDVKPRKAAKLAGAENVKTRISRLEEDLSNVKKRHDALSELLFIMRDVSHGTKSAVLAAVALCRGFCRMIASEEIQRSKTMTEDQADNAEQLRTILKEYVRLLHSWIGDADAAKENAAVTLTMRIVKQEVQLEALRSDSSWRLGSHFSNLVGSLLSTSDAAAGRQLFVEKYVEEHDDVRFYTFLAIKQILGERAAPADLLPNALELLGQIEGVPQAKDQLEDWYGAVPEGKHTLLSLAAHLRAAREAWLSVFRLPLTGDQRQVTLGMLREQLIPWFAGHLESLTDFLTDSFNTTGSAAVLALDGIYHLITERNIDYPDFYSKLYSLLDEDILHSRHRSPFLRLLDKCMSSSHLPSVLVASFMKRLARLALQAPPGAIVWLVPWTYNLLRTHPNCTFMLHRTEHPSHAIYAAHPDAAESGMKDPFDMKQADPMLTGAIDSSLWELETLMSHYHPNVATLASILGEQFTKRDYQLEDFLDHSYNTLLEGELSRELKKEPVVEWEIPKRIITNDAADGFNALGSLLQAAIDVL